MSASWPSTSYACPCSELTTGPPPPNAVPGGPSPPTTSSGNADDEGKTFNPHDPRANYSLYPLDHLLYCDECDAIRCPRCWIEEIINWYCPSCLFEVPTSAVKSDGNRCSRNCYNCPLCTSPLTISSAPSDDTIQLPDGATNESFMLLCQYCDWTSLDVNIRFDRPTKITEQLSKIRKSKENNPFANHDETYNNLTNFYKEQLNEAGDPQNPFQNSPYSSPANLARIMSLYGGLSQNALKKAQEKPRPMRESKDGNEGLLAYTTGDPDDEEDIIDKMEKLGWNGTANDAQKRIAPVNNDARFLDDLWPIATHLRTRRGKRCSTCRQFVIRPDPKMGSVKYKIRLLGVNFVPRLSLRPLNAIPAPSNPAFRLQMEEPIVEPLKPYAPLQYVLTIRNPIFEKIKISLATPGITPGKVASKVTILCPSFNVGPAGDIWDDALGSGTPGQSTAADGGRKAAMASLTGSNGDTERQPEAGKIWDRTRNSTSVIIEIVPGSLKSPPKIVPANDTDAEEEELGEDGDMLQIPIHVDVQWEAHEEEHGSLANKREERKPSTSDNKVAKELSYWCVLNVGKTADS